MLLNSSAWELHEQKGWLSAFRGEQVLGRNSCAALEHEVSLKRLVIFIWKKTQQTNQLQAHAGWHDMLFFIAAKLSNVQTIKYSQLHSNRQCPSCCREGLMWKAFHPHPLGGTRILSLLPNGDTQVCQCQGLSFCSRWQLLHSRTLSSDSPDFKLMYQGKYFLYQLWCNLKMI